MVNQNKKNTEENTMPRSAMDLYRQYRGYNISELADQSGLTRQTVGAACGGDLKLGEKSLAAIARALHVHVSDLDQNMPRNEILEKTVDIPAGTEKIMAAIQTCEPQYFKEKEETIVRFINKKETVGRRIKEIMDFLLDDSYRIREAMLYPYFQKIKSKPWCSPDYDHKIGIYYCADRKKGFYNVGILFEEWVYDVFHLEKTYMDDENGRKLLSQFFIETMEEEGGMEFECDIRDQLTTELLDVSNDLPKDVRECFASWMMDWINEADIFRCEIPQDEKLRDKLEQSFESLFQNFTEQGGGGAAIQEAAQCFSQMLMSQEGPEDLFKNLGFDEELLTIWKKVKETERIQLKKVDEV